MKKNGKKQLRAAATAMAVTLVLTGFVYFSWVALHNTRSVLTGQSSDVSITPKSDDAYVLELGEERFYIQTEKWGQIKEEASHSVWLTPRLVRIAKNLEALLAGIQDTAP